MDAPGHFVEGGRLSPDITLQELIVPIVVIDISTRAAGIPTPSSPSTTCGASSAGHGRIPDGALVCMDSGWAAKVDDPLEFKGGAAFPNYHFPGFSLEAAMWLAERRDVTGIGVDTISLDPGNSTTFPVHVNFLATDRYGLEGLNNLDRIPPHGARRLCRLDPLGGGLGRALPRDRELVRLPRGSPRLRARASRSSGGPRGPRGPGGRPPAGSGRRSGPRACPAIHAKTSRARSRSSSRVAV